MRDPEEAIRAVLSRCGEDVLTDAQRCRRDVLAAIAWHARQHYLDCCLVAGVEPGEDYDADSPEMLDLIEADRVLTAGRE